MEVGDAVMAWAPRCGLAGLAMLSLALAGCIPKGHLSEYDSGRTPPPTRPSDLANGDSGGPIRGTDIPSSVRQPTPSWLTRSVTPDAQTVADGSYVVRRGDTLRSIGNRTGAGSEAIARANNIPAPFVVRVGQRLKIPGGRYHLVREGQSGVAIARAYGLDWSAIADLNNLQPPYILRTGQRLALPGGGTAGGGRPSSIEARALAFDLNIDDLATGSEPAIAPHEQPKAATATPARPMRTDVAVAEPRTFTGRFGWPLSGKVIQRFGPAGDGRRNDGINIAADRGDAIHAAADGVVAYAGSAIAVYGGLILIKHGGGWITAYGHAEKILVTRGQTVKRGDVIGQAGATGSVNRPQLHFEIRDKRTPVDPLRYLGPQG
jgi:murein DD-endopeptidase MepM/ murein hydrolase activator NlpD